MLPYFTATGQTELPFHNQLHSYIKFLIHQRQLYAECRPHICVFFFFFIFEKTNKQTTLSFQLNHLRN